MNVFFFFFLSKSPWNRKTLTEYGGRLEPLYLHDQINSIGQSLVSLVASAFPSSGLAQRAHLSQSLGHDVLIYFFLFYMEVFVITFNLYLIASLLFISFTYFFVCFARQVQYFNAYENSRCDFRWVCLEPIIVFVFVLFLVFSYIHVGFFRNQVVFILREVSKN